MDFKRGHGQNEHIFRGDPSRISGVARKNWDQINPSVARASAIYFQNHNVNVLAPLRSRQWESALGVYKAEFGDEIVRNAIQEITVLEEEYKGTSSEPGLDAELTFFMGVNQYGWLGSHKHVSIDPVSRYDDISGKGDFVIGFHDKKDSKLDFEIIIDVGYFNDDDLNLGLMQKWTDGKYPADFIRSKERKSGMAGGTFRHIRFALDQDGKPRSAPNIRDSYMQPGLYAPMIALPIYAGELGNFLLRVVNNNTIQDADWADRVNLLSDGYRKHIINGLINGCERQLSVIRSLPKDSDDAELRSRATAEQQLSIAKKYFESQLVEYKERCTLQKKFLSIEQLESMQLRLITMAVKAGIHDVHGDDAVSRISAGVVVLPPEKYQDLTYKPEEEDITKDPSEFVFAYLIEQGYITVPSRFRNRPEVFIGSYLALANSIPHFVDLLTYDDREGIRIPHTIIAQAHLLGIRFSASLMSAMRILQKREGAIRQEIADIHTKIASINPHDVEQPDKSAVAVVMNLLAEYPLLSLSVNNPWYKIMPSLYTKFPDQMQAIKKIFHHYKLAETENRINDESIREKFAEEVKREFINSEETSIINQQKSFVESLGILWRAWLNRIRISSDPDEREAVEELINRIKENGDDGMDRVVDIIEENNADSVEFVSALHLLDRFQHDLITPIFELDPSFMYYKATSRQDILLIDEAIQKVRTYSRIMPEYSYRTLLLKAGYIIDNASKLESCVKAPNEITKLTAFAKLFLKYDLIIKRIMRDVHESDSKDE